MGTKRDAIKTETPRVQGSSAKRLSIGRDTEASQVYSRDAPSHPKTKETLLKRRFPTYVFL
ncbi:hypothetical protein HMPREF1640_02245 [Prevotella sp. S7-1-8]|nr:hypothetical protein HMPREF1640_02245 [Prevotella sp. S7-1-8]